MDALHRSPRVRFKHPIRVSSLEGAPRIVRTLTANLSHQGLFVRMPEPMPTGSRVALSLEAAGQALPFAEAEIIWCRLQDSNLPGRYPGFGVRFQRFLHPRAEALVKYLVENLDRGKPLTLPSPPRQWKRTLVGSGLAVAGMSALGALTALFLDSRSEPSVPMVRAFSTQSPATLSTPRAAPANGRGAPGGEEARLAEGEGSASATAQRDTTPTGSGEGGSVDGPAIPAAGNGAPEIVAAPGGAAENGPAANGAATNGAATSGSATSGSAANGSAANGSAANETAQNGVAQNGAAQNGAAQNGAAQNGAAQNGAAQHGSFANDSAATGSTASGTEASGAVANGSAANPTVANASAANGSEPSRAAQSGTSPATEPLAAIPDEPVKPHALPPPRANERRGELVLPSGAARAVSWALVDRELRLSAEADAGALRRAFVLEGPPRVVFDIEGSVPFKSLSLAGTTPFIKQVRVGRQGDSSTRVVVDLTRAPTDVSPDGDAFIISF